jgi:hypothetical protein
MGLFPYNKDFGQIIKTDVNKKSTDRGFIAHLELDGDDIPANNNNGVLALTDLGTATTKVEEGFEEIAYPRNLSIVGSASNISGNVVVKGTNIAGEEITETIALNGITGVAGNKAFASVYEVTLPIRTNTPTKQVETLTVVGTATEKANETIIVTSALLGEDVVIELEIDGGTQQVEEVEVEGLVTNDGAGNIDVTVTAEGMDNSPKIISVAVANEDDAETIATKIKTALDNDADVGHVETGFFAITRTDSILTFTFKAKAENDDSFDFAVVEDSATVTDLDAIIVNKTLGVASDDATVIANKFRDAMLLEDDITDNFVVSGTGANIILTAREFAPNDATLNIAITGDVAGVNTVANSANTTVGVGIDKISIGWGAKLGLPYKLPHNTVLHAHLNNVRESTITVVTSATAIENNTITLGSSLNGTNVNIYLVV